ncbi:hypothetical protein [Halalkalicoccus salilacus]|uniref:hypothetical protein n=1 Tax=Halalkalicoccus salilacus TaxID=3117459 RepID=UPI00300F006A
MDCQYCIEISVKSIHKIIGRKYQTNSHGLEFGHGDTQEFTNNIPADFTHENKVPRAIFLTQFWDTFYELSKYGAPKVDKDPEDIFHWRDAERAIEDATFCLNLAFHLLDYAVDTYEIDDPRPDPSNLELNLTIDPYSLDYEQK